LEDPEGGHTVSNFNIIHNLKFPYISCLNLGISEWPTRFWKVYFYKRKLSYKKLKYSITITILPQCQKYFCFLLSLCLFTVYPMLWSTGQAVSILSPEPPYLHGISQSLPSISISLACWNVCKQGSFNNENLHYVKLVPHFLVELSFVVPFATCCFQSLHSCRHFCIKAFLIGLCFQWAIFISFI